MGQLAVAKPARPVLLPGFNLPSLFAALFKRGGSAKGRSEASSEDAVSDEASRLFDQYGNSIYRLAYSYVHTAQDAEDVLQDTLVQYLRNEPTFNDAKHEKAWLLRVAANLSKNVLRARKAHQTDEIDDQLPASMDADLSFVWEAVRELPETQREVVHLFYQEGYATKEIAQILGRNENTVRSDLSRARTSLKQVLKEAYDFE